MRFNEDFVYFPKGFPRPGDDPLQVKSDVFWKLRVYQDAKCTVCQEYLTNPVDIHEALVTKGDIQGWPARWRIIIINPYNCVLVHRHCHAHGDRESTWKLKCEQFGEDEIIKWYESLPFRVPLRKLA